LESNEITALVPMLEDVDIEGMVVTTDALHNQKESARFIVQQKRADYFFTVKDNQSTLKEDIESLHVEAFPPQDETVEKGHGRI
jgi:predicted transposase YbfD/YdcC